MAEKDELDREVSASFELTEAGVKAAANSRTVSALDRLGGSLLKRLFSRRDQLDAEQAAVSRARVAAIDKVSELGLTKLERDQEFANAAIARHFETIFARQENKLGVAKYTLEDLRREPPSEEESAAGPESLSAEFIVRHERYAEDATTEELRERWGRVLATEIRKPGTFSGKSLRVIDELDAAVARLFEKVCRHQLLGVIPKCLVEPLNVMEKAWLVDAGLIVEPTAGHIRPCFAITDKFGTERWAWKFGEFVIAYPQGVHLPQFAASDQAVLTIGLDQNPALPVYVLTPVGEAVSSILPNQTREALIALRNSMRSALNTIGVEAYERLADRDDYNLFAEGTIEAN